MRISHKLILGFAAIVLLLGVVGYVSLIQLNKIAHPLRKDIPESVKAIAHTSRLDGLAQFIRYYDEVLTQSARNYAFTKDKKNDPTGIMAYSRFFNNLYIREVESVWMELPELIQFISDFCI